MANCSITISARITAAFFSLALGLAGSARPAEACSCVPSRSPCEQLTSGAVIFVGTPRAVVRVEKGTARIRIAVDQRIAGELGDTVEIETADSTAACGFPFRIGAKYLVYANPASRGLHVSLCSRTGEIEDRQDDLALLKETAAGQPRTRLAGRVLSSRLLLDGFYLHIDSLTGLADVPIVVRGASDARETRTDSDGGFSIVGLTPGTYRVEARLPAPYRPSFRDVESVDLDGCIGEALIFVSPVALSGQVRRADGSPVGAKLMLRIAQLDSQDRVLFPNTTLAFTKANGEFSFPGLPAGRYVLGVNFFDAPSPDTPYGETWYRDGRRPAEATVIQVRNDRPQTIDFQLPAPLTAVTIRGRVIDQHGNGLVDAFVSMYDDDDPNARVSHGDNMAFARTDTEGHFTITGFAGRRYHVEARSPFAGLKPMVTSRRVPVPMNTASPTVTISLRIR